MSTGFVPSTPQEYLLSMSLVPRSFKAGARTEPLGAVLLCGPVMLVEFVPPFRNKFCFSCFAFNDMKLELPPPWVEVATPVVMVYDVPVLVFPAVSVSVMVSGCNPSAKLTLGVHVHEPSEFTVVVQIVITPCFMIRVVFASA